MVRGSYTLEEPRPSESAKNGSWVAFSPVYHYISLLEALAWLFQRPSVSLLAFVSNSKWSLREAACLATAVCRLSI